MKIYTVSSFPMFFVLAVTLIGLSACSPTHIKPRVLEAPEEAYTAVVVGKISSQNELWGQHMAYVREGMIRRLRESGEFVTVENMIQGPMPESCMIVTGTINEFDEGSEATRFIIGFGAGNASVGGLFEIANEDGDLLASFNAREVYAGGVGIGGPDMLNMAQLMTRLGEETADTVIRWKNGEKL